MNTSAKLSTAVKLIIYLCIPLIVWGALIATHY